MERVSEEANYVRIKCIRIAAREKGREIDRYIYIYIWKAEGIEIEWGKRGRNKG